MKIAYFITGLGLGGAEVITLDLARQAHAAGHRVVVVYLSQLDALANSVPPGAELFAVNMRKTPAGLLGALWRARRIVRDFRPDVVHSNMFHSNIFTRLLRLVAPIPALICSEHTANAVSGARLWAYRLTAPLSDLDTNVSVVAVDEFVASGAFRRSHTMVVYNGVDTRRFSPDRTAGRSVRTSFGVAPDQFLWLNVGRLTQAKDQTNLIRAFARVVNKSGARGGHLVILGDGELRDTLQKLIDETQLTSRVTLAGAHHDMPRFYNAADCLVVSSAWEGFSVAIVEAMACGLPVVTTDVSGAVEALQSSETVVPIHRDDLLAQKMLYVGELSTARRGQLGRQNRHLAERFDLDNIWQQWEKIYATTRRKKSSSPTTPCGEC
jgi:glycosyltransferase involved in cell wall biosynthesis